MSATAAPVSPFPGYCFPPEIISHAVWLYRRFCLSLRDVEELLAERGIRVSYGDPSLLPQVRHAAGKRASSAPSTTGRQVVSGRGSAHDEQAALLAVAGSRSGWTVLDILVQSRRDQHAAERFLNRVLDAGDGVEPRVIITHKLASYVPAIKRVVPNGDQRRHTRLNKGPRTRIGRSANVSRRCNGSSRRAGAAIPGDLQCGVQPLPSAPAPSLSEAIPPCASDSSSGVRSHACRRQPTDSAIRTTTVRQQHFRPVAPINLSMPLPCLPQQYR